MSSFNTIRKMSYLLLPFPFYLLFTNLFYNLFSIIFGGSPRIMLYGFTCVTYSNFINLSFLSLYVLFKLFFTFIGYRSLKSQTLIPFLAFSIIFVDSLSFFAFLFDNAFQTYFRFYFFASTPNYSLSYILFDNKVIIPILFLGLTLFLSKKMLSKLNLYEFCYILFGIVLNTLLCCVLIMNIFN